MTDEQAKPVQESSDDAPPPVAPNMSEVDELKAKNEQLKEQVASLTEEDPASKHHLKRLKESLDGIAISSKQLQDAHMLELQKHVRAFAKQIC